MKENTLFDDVSIFGLKKENEESEVQKTRYLISYEWIKMSTGAWVFIYV